MGQAPPEGNARTGLSTQAVVLAGSRAAGQLIMVLVVAAVARAVGVERMGLLAASIAFAAIFSGLLDFGSGSHWVREVSSGRMSLLEFGGRSGGKLLVAVCLSAVILVSALLFPNWKTFWGIALLFFSSVASQTMQASLLATGGGIRLTWISALERVVFGASFIAIASIIKLRPEDVFFVSYLLGALVSLTVALGVLPRDIRPTMHRLPGFWVWKGSRYYGFSSAFIALQSADVIIGGGVGGAATAGTYGAVSRWTTPITIATTSFAVLLAPVVAGAKNANDVWIRIRGSLWIPGISVVIAILMAIMAEPVVLLLMGREFVGSAAVLRWLALSAGLSATAQPLMTILQARRRERFVARGFGISVTMQLIMVAPLVWYFGAVGIALAAVFAQLALVSILSLGAVLGWKESQVLRVAI